MPLIGFSTGALRQGDFRGALNLLQETATTAVELSALRIHELPILIQALPELDLQQYSYISFHAPSRFSADEEEHVVELLRGVPADWPIILHPDTIHDVSRWTGFGSQLLIENMDRRKTDARDAKELCSWFEKLPEAGLCLDLAHAHQVDRTMTEAYRILRNFSDKVRQLHISELDSAGHHFPLSYGSIRAFSEVAALIPPNAPAILESLIPPQESQRSEQIAWIMQEVERAEQALTPDTKMIPVTPLSNPGRMDSLPAHA